MKIGEQLKALRKTRKMTMQQLADLTGISKSHISHIEKDKWSIRLDTLEKLLVALEGELKVVDLLAPEHREPEPAGTVEDTLAELELERLMEEIDAEDADAELEKL